MSEIESVLKENRSFVPAEDFRAQARIGDRETYDRMHRESLEDPGAEKLSSARTLLRLP